MARRAFLVLAFVCAATVIACGGGGSSSSARTGSVDVSAVPELKDGSLDIGSDIAYAPIEFLDEKTNQPIGLDVDIANALADRSEERRVGKECRL